MLTIFRRHTKNCKFRSRKHRNCQCLIAVEGMLHGRMTRKSFDLRSLLTFLHPATVNGGKSSDRGSPTTWLEI